MPVSTNIFKKETEQYILSAFSKECSILDVGPGIGTYADMLRPLGYTNIDCIEIFPDYIKQYGLVSKYSRVFTGNVMDMDPRIINSYDLVIFGDVWEHLSKEDALRMYKTFDPSLNVIIAVPYNAEQGIHYDNKYEIHLQPDLDYFVFKERYPNLLPLGIRYDYGVYVSFTINPITYVLDAHWEQMTDLLKSGRTLKLASE